MKIAALYDVHGMPHALEAVLAEVEREGCDAIVFGGDVLCGPLPRETLELVRSVDAQFIRGNCEDESSEFQRERIGEETERWLASWPLTLELDGVLYCHSLPTSNVRIVTERTPDAVFDAALDGIETRLVVGGHSHHQFRRGRYVNAGSVGMPYEGDVAAFWAIISDDVEFRRTPFPVERAAEAIAASGWPRAESFVQENLLIAPVREEAIEWLEQRRNADQGRTRR